LGELVTEQKFESEEMELSKIRAIQKTHSSPDLLKIVWKTQKNTTPDRPDQGNTLH